MSAQAAQEAVERALDLLGRASIDWQNADASVPGGLHWPAAVSLARRELRTALLALAGATNPPVERQRVLTFKGDARP